MARPDNLSESVELALREEIRATQASQAEAAKWKFVAVAAVGAISLGATGDGTLGTERLQLLWLIPLICLYVDLTCLHYILRVVAIGAFIKSSYARMRAGLGREQHADGSIDYESFIFTLRGWSTDARPSPFALELIATLGSSLAIDLLLLVAAGAALLSPLGAASDLNTRLAGVAFPFLGLLGTALARREYGRRLRRIRETMEAVEEAKGRER